MADDNNDPDRYNYNLSRWTRTFHMDRPRHFVQKLITPLLRNVSEGRYSGLGMGRLRPTLRREQVSVIPISALDPKTGDIYNINLYMKNDTAYVIGISVGAGIRELLDNFTDPTMLHDSIPLGEEFKYKYQRLKYHQNIKHETLVQAVLFIGRNLYVANTLSRDEKKELKRSIELMVAESLRNEWVMEKFNEILNHHVEISDMEVICGDLIWNWKTLSEISRVSYGFTDLSEEADRRYLRKSLGLLFNDWESPYACEREVTLKCCNRPSDFRYSRMDRRWVEIFDYSPGVLTQKLYRYAPPCRHPPRDAYYDPWCAAVLSSLRRSDRYHSGGSGRDRSGRYHPY